MDVHWCFVFLDVCFGGCWSKSFFVEIGVTLGFILCFLFVFWWSKA